MTLRERYFVGVLGWVKEVDQALNLEVYRERVDGEVLSHPSLPPIEYDFREFKKWVIGPMWEVEWRLTLEDYGNSRGSAY